MGCRSKAVIILYTMQVTNLKMLMYRWRYRLKSEISCLGGRRCEALAKPVPMVEIFFFL